ncbi:MAG: hypothetical protein Kow00121_28950 [Elainellaceae cyanobacterium]
MTTLLIDTDAIQSALHSAAIDLQNRFVREEGEVYRVEDLQRALTNWLELSIESLVEDATFHAVEGDCASAFNRHDFEQQMKRVKPVETVQGREQLPLKALQALIKAA